MATDRPTSRRPLLWAGAVVVLAAGIVASTVATLLEGREHPLCPDDAFGCVETGGAEGSIRIAALLPLTGPQAEAGLQARRGIELALALRGGSISGHPLRLVSRDDACSADRIALAARKLAVDQPESPPITAVIGAACTEVTEPAAQILSDSGIPLVSWSSAEVEFIDPPPSRSFYVPLAPASTGEDFADSYADRFGSPPTSPWALEAFRATKLLLEAIDRVAIRAPEGELLIPRLRLRETLRRAA